MNSSVFKQHQLRIARDTLKMGDVMAKIMGGMSKKEARQIVAEHKRSSAMVDAHKKNYGGS